MNIKIELLPNQIVIGGKRYFFKNQNGVSDEIYNSNTNSITYCIYNSKKVNNGIPYFKVTSFIQMSENLDTGVETVLSTFGTKIQIGKLKFTNDI